jgi:hypothetical protein
MMEKEKREKQAKSVTSLVCVWRRETKIEIFYFKK